MGSLTIWIQVAERATGPLPRGSFARKIQTAYRRWKAQQFYEELKRKASDILLNKKERRIGTINRNFVGDYIGAATTSAPQWLHRANPGAAQALGRTLPCARSSARRSVWNSPTRWSSTIAASDPRSGICSSPATTSTWSVARSRRRAPIKVERLASCPCRFLGLRCLCCHARLGKLGRQERGVIQCFSRRLQANSWR